MALTMTLLNAGTARWGGSSLFYSVKNKTSQKVLEQVTTKNYNQSSRNSKMTECKSSVKGNWQMWSLTVLQDGQGGRGQGEEFIQEPHLSAQSAGCLAPLPLVPERESQTN